MAITKCLHMKQAKTGYPAKHLANGLRYIMNPEKTEHGRYVCGHNCIPEQALSQMVDTNVILESWIKGRATISFFRLRKMRFRKKKPSKW